MEKAPIRVGLHGQFEALMKTEELHLVTVNFYKRLIYDVILQMTDTAIFLETVLCHSSQYCVHGSHCGL